MEVPKSKKELAILLSRVRGYTSPKAELEQYVTPSEIASRLIWAAYERGRIVGKNVCDLGAGTGILIIGAMLLGARRGYAVEKDPDAIEDLKRNLSAFGLERRVEIVEADVSDVELRVDTVVMNPPYGVQRKGASLPFLIKATEIGECVYMIVPRGLLEEKRAILEDRGFGIEFVEEDWMELPPTYPWHDSRMYRFRVCLVGFAK